MNGDESRDLRRGMRLDLVIAVCALIVSAAATAASGWQSRVIVTNPTQAVAMIFPKRQGKRFRAQLSDVKPGVVIRASSLQQLFKFVAPWAVEPFSAASGRIDFVICYCS